VEAILYKLGAILRGLVLVLRGSSFEGVSFEGVAQGQLVTLRGEH
jgi:hypothetical protein